MDCDYSNTEIIYTIYTEKYDTNIIVHEFIFHVHKPETPYFFLLMS